MPGKVTMVMTASFIHLNMSVYVDFQAINSFFALLSHLCDYQVLKELLEAVNPLSPSGAIRCEVFFDSVMAM